MNQMTKICVEASIHHVFIEIIAAGNHEQCWDFCNDLMNRGTSTIGIDLLEVHKRALQDYYSGNYATYANHAGLFDTCQSISMLMNTLEEVNCYKSK